MKDCTNKGRGTLKGCKGQRSTEMVDKVVLDLPCSVLCLCDFDWASVKSF